MSPKSRFIFIFLLMSNTLLLVFLTNIVLTTRDDVLALENKLASKTDVANLHQASAQSVLEEKCTGCHSATRFADFHGTEADLMAMIEDMQGITGASFNAGNVERVHASLELLKCSQCHLGEGEIRQLALKSEAEQKETIRRMLQRTEGAEKGEVDELQQAYQEIYGF